MIKVKTLVEHSNSYGEKQAKAKGSTYEVPDYVAEHLTAEGYVEVGKSTAKDG